MLDKSFDDILENFSAGEHDETFHERHKPLTVWIPNTQKSKYDNLQKKSGFEFSKRLREIIILAIEKAEQRAS
jgi:hypothetical protein